jgi:membrane protease subunit HflK
MFASFFKKIGLTLSLNDPQWGRGSKNNNDDGKKPNDGPPDLDQLWRDFNQRISRLLGQKGSGDGGSNGGNGGFTPDAASAKIGAGIILVVFAFIWMASGFFIVQEGQTGVVTTFGKYRGIGDFNCCDFAGLKNASHIRAVKRNCFIF